MFKPRWKKEALLLLKGAKKFLHYKRDLLAPDRIDEIESRRADLKTAIKAKDLNAVKESSKQLRNTCEKSLAHYRPPEWLQENIEVFWVAIVVALGIRAYFLQPFRIPTGSMQPSLNGIVATSTEDIEGWKKPWIGKRAVDFLISGRSYENVVAKKDLNIKDMKDASFFLFSRTKIFFDDGSTVVIGSPVNEAAQIPTITAALKRRSAGLTPHFAQGDPIFQGYLTSGDLVLVDKLSYHFRQPKRGESFVFDTRDIPTGGPKSLSDQDGGTHYIKRLVGVPGDKLSIKYPNLYVNGSIAKEETLQRVMKMGNDAKGDPYPGYYNPPGGGKHNSGFADPAFVRELDADPKEGNNYREFFALGDNSPSSLDSRYWGSVKQYNLVGPAFISLWPFTSGHWGLIK
ncbi:signal peptidase I [bacterium]|nr:signal peptidase I [bacterium]